MESQPASGNADISYPLGTEPAVGGVVEVAKGLLWSRLPLPYPPFHVNTYCLVGTDGVCVIETGLNDDATSKAWDELLASALKGNRITRVMPTHWHSDHVGFAGALCSRFDAPLVMTEAEYLTSVVYRTWSPERARELREPFFAQHGLDASRLKQWLDRGYYFLDLLSPWPDSIERVAGGDRLRIADHDWEAHTLAGHSPEELTLYDRQRNLYICADQLTPKLAPNIAVWPYDPLGDPLGRYLNSLDYVDQTVKADALVLPAHEAPYLGLQARTQVLRAYYARRVGLVEGACREHPRTATELLSVLWRREPDPVWIGFMLGEVVSYLNFLARRGRVDRLRTNGVLRFKARES